MFHIKKNHIQNDYMYIIIAIPKTTIIKLYAQNVVKNKIKKELVFYSWRLRGSL